MKKILVLIAVFLLLCSYNSFAGMNCATKYHKIRARVFKQDITHEQKTAGKITQKMSHILQELSGLGGGVHYNHQTDIKNMKKSWDPFAAQAATED